MNGVRYNFETVKQIFKDNGLELLEDHYINNKQKLKCRCSNNHITTKRLNDLVCGHGCSVCGSISAASCRKNLYKMVKDVFTARGFTLLSNEYINNQSDLLCLCPNGHEHTTTYNNFKAGAGCLKCYHQRNGELHKNNIASYVTYAKQLERYHKVHLITRKNIKILGVNCTYCNKIYAPKSVDVINRLRAIDGKTTGYPENNLYCSDECKRTCPTFRQRDHEKNYKQGTSRELQPQLRKLVLERDNWTCKKCNSKENGLHCHHIDPVANNPIESADIDNCITLCKECHKEVHSINGCGYNELTCK